jgi:hypothetical protein
MSKVIKIKESKVLDLITKIITENTVGEIKVTASSDLGTHPEFKGLKTLLAQLKTNVQTALRGKIPYRVKTTSDEGTVTPKKQGNALVLEVTLIPCEQEKRHWFFDGAAAIYSYVNTTSFSAVEGKVRTAAMNKAETSFIGSQPQEAYPNHIGLSKFTGLNTNEPEKVYQLILKFFVGKRPGGFYDVGDDESGDQKLAGQDSALKDTETVANATTNAAAVAQNNNTGSEKESSGDALKSVEEEWTSTTIDLAHAVKPFLTETQKGLEEMYKKGKNPTVENIVMTITKSPGGSFKTRVTADIVESTDGKAWVGIDSRGSAGKDYVVRADDQYLGGRYDKDGKPVMELDPETKEMKQVNDGQRKYKKDGTDNPCYGKSLINCMKLPQVGGEDVKLAATIEDPKFPFKQYFVIFTKPEKFPPIK